VRFKIDASDEVFGRLPALQAAAGSARTLFDWDRDVESCKAGADEEAARNQLDNLWDESLKAEQTGALTKARHCLGRFLQLTRGLRKGNLSSAPLQQYRNSAIDKLDAMTALDQGSSPQAVGEYLLARNAFDSLEAPTPAWFGERRKSAPGITVKQSLRGGLLSPLAACRADRNLSDNVAYLEAAFHYRYGEKIGVETFEEVIRRYPASEKREAAMFMSAVASMKESRSFSGGGPDVREDDAGVRDQPWKTAQQAFLRLMNEYPKGQYYADAWGWRAHLWLKVSKRANALAEYYRMLASDNDAAKEEAVASLRLARRYASDDEMLKVEEQIQDEPSAAMAYAYHEIYNYAVWHRGEPGGYDSASGDCEKERANRELERIAAFSTRMISRYPGSRVGAGFVLRVAEANLELKKNEDAARLARRALAMSAREDTRAEALWVAGTAEHRLGRYRSARRALEMLVAENQNNSYTEGGRRLLAMLLEDTGDLELALDQYLALDYRYDVAYFVDVLMPTDRLAAFVRLRSSAANRDELLYALAIRYMRDRRWKEASETLAAIKPLGRIVDDQYRYSGCGAGSDDYLEFPKDMPVDPSIRGIRLAWQEQDLRTISDLVSLEQKYELAADEDAKAEGLYQVASYQFEGSLQFYNAAAWRGIRHYLLYDLSYRGNFRRPDEPQ
jgi:outer membrane protein assembly factor BamD (BamD/ComL family)